MELNEQARHALAVWDGTEVHIDAGGFELIGTIERAQLVVDALRAIVDAA